MYAYSVSEHGLPVNLLKNASCEGSRDSSGEAIHVAMGIEPFAFYELKFMLDGESPPPPPPPHVFELINFEGLHQTSQALRDELEEVDELESVHSDGEIVLHVLWNYLQNSLFSALTIR